MKPDKSTAAFAMNMAMHANLVVLSYQLAEAAKLTESARNAMEAHDRNLAIGTVMPLERVLPDCETLLRGVLALQTWHNQLPTREGGAA